MNKESQVSGCYNITFVYINQDQIPPESNALVPRQQLKLNHDLLLQGHVGKEDAAVTAAVVVLNVLGCRLTY